MNQKYSAINYALYLLSKRDYSEKELRHKLTLKEYEEQEIEQAVERAKENGWQSDERFCAGYIRYRSRQGIGALRLKQELRLKGIADWQIEDELDKAEIDWYELAETVFEKKRPNRWDLKAKQKMWRFMISRGFERDQFYDLLKVDYEE